LDFCLAQKIRLEILDRCQLEPNVRFMKAATIKDEIFILYSSISPNGDQDLAIRVYNRSQMAEVKEVIPLPDMKVGEIAACSVSNCAYLLYCPIFLFFGIARVTKDDQGQSTITHMATNETELLQFSALSVTVDGILIMSGWLQTASLYVVRSFDANGSLQREIKCTWLSSTYFPIYGIIPKSSGHHVLVSFDDSGHSYLTEINADGTILSKYQSPSAPRDKNHCAGVGEELTLMSESLVKMELLDSEFNLLDFNYSQLFTVPRSLHYNHERNELITIANSVLTISKFIDE